MISRDLEKLANDVTIDYTADPQNAGFVLTSEHPISEWSGFGICLIKA